MTRTPVTANRTAPGTRLDRTSLLNLLWVRLVEGWLRLRGHGWHRP
jgi:hypothetical protein